MSARTVKGALEKAQRAQDAKTIARDLSTTERSSGRCVYCGVKVTPGNRSCPSHADVARAEAGFHASLSSGSYATHYPAKSNSSTTAGTRTNPDGAQRVPARRSL